MIPAIPGRVSVISNAFKVTSVSTVYSSREIAATTPGSR